MNENCTTFQDSQSHEVFECKELPKMPEEDFQQFLGALRWDIEWSLPNIPAIVKLLETLKSSSNDTERNELKSSLETTFSVHGNLPEVLELETLFYLIQAGETWDWMHVRNAASIVRKLIDIHGYKTGTSDTNICDELYGMLFGIFKRNTVSSSDVASTIQILGKDFRKYFQEMIQYEEDAIIRQRLRQLYKRLYEQKRVIRKNTYSYE